MVRSRLKGAARQVMSDLMNARMTAVSLNQKVKVHIEGDGHTYKIWSDANNDGTVASSEGVNISKDLHQDYHDVALTTTNDPIFNPRGAASAIGTVTVTNSAGSRDIAVAISGRVAVSN
ncbi:MAG TPA: GspH/FimT family protein [Syntrophales bacterium]|nr:GspH/FimT family protein [Syntrophales bacterium]